MVVQVGVDAGSCHGIVDVVRDVGAAHHLFIRFSLVQAIGTRIHGALESGEDSHAIRAVDPLVWLTRRIPKEEEDAKVPGDEVFPHSEEYQPLSAVLGVLCTSAVSNSLGLGASGLDILMIPPGGGPGTLGLSPNDGKWLAGPYSFSTSVST